MYEQTQSCTTKKETIYQTIYETNIAENTSIKHNR